MRSNVKKLQLNKETLRHLTSAELDGVVGGRKTNEQSAYNTCGSCNTLCPGGGECEDPTIANTCGCSPTDMYC